jgi:DNA polymerase-3 subunit gamma/tau
VRRVWDEVLTVLRRRSQRAAALAREAIVRDVHGDEIVLVFQHLAHANMFSSWADLLIEAVHEVLGGVWTVRAELGGDQNPRGGATGQPSLLGPSAGEESPRTEPAGPPVKTGDWPAPAQLGGWQDIGPDAAAQQSAAARADRTPPRSNRASDRGAEPGRQAARGPAEPPAGRAPAAKRGATKERPAGGTKASRTKADTTDTTDTTGTTGAAGRARQVAQPTGAGPVGGPEWEEPTPDEPPFDPDHDAAPGPQLGRRLEGFDPGDEPLDDAVDPAIARQSSHEQAARLLSEQLGAEPYEDPRARG